MTAGDKKFLLGFKNLEPDWAIYDFERFPGIIWKLDNLKKLKAKNPEKHTKLFEALKRTLDNFKAD